MWPSLAHLHLPGPLLAPWHQYINTCKLLVRWLCCARIPFSFEVDRYNEQPANRPFDLYVCIVAREEPPVIVGLETAVQMNLVQIGTNEFFPNSPLLNSGKPSTATKEIGGIPLCYVHE